MSYELRISPEAERQFARQPEPVRAFIQTSLLRLAASPTSVRTDAARNYLLPAAEFRFDGEPGVSLWITVEFAFGADERTLHIERIHVEFGA